MCIEKKAKGKSQLLLALTVGGLMGVLCLQTIWLYNIYTLINGNIQREAYAIMVKALEEEGNIRFGQTPDGTEVMSGPTNDTIPPMAYFYERLSDMGYPMNLVDLDSITRTLMMDAKMYCEYTILLTNPIKGDILQQCGSLNNSFFSIESDIFPVRSDYTRAVQLVLANPQKIFFERMGLVLLATVLLMIFIVGCIIYLVRIISNLRKLNKTREEFSYAMIHDMKMPLTTIAMVLDFWHKGKLDGKAEVKNRYCQIAEEETQHLLALANKVLTISKLENHKLEMNKGKVKLVPLVSKLTERFAAKAEKTVHFTIDLKAEEVYADGEYLEEVLGNLIDNSIKYSDEKVNIRISSEKEGGCSIIRVYDDGWGISVKSRQAIFEKFERGDMQVKKRRRRVAGFGLGLNFVQKVMDSHGGRVMVSSMEGEFTEFSLCFPNEGKTDDMTITNLTEELI